MAKQRYYLDSRVLTAFFFAAMPFVAFGSFILVSRAAARGDRRGATPVRAPGPVPATATARLPEG